MRILCSLLLSLVLFSSCHQPEATITVRNDLAEDRQAETVSVSVKDLEPVFGARDLSTLAVTDAETGAALLSQWIDNDLDSLNDELIFQTDIKASQKKTFILKATGDEVTPSQARTYSRFVPERTDDYAWENDRVAFRTYGPDAQRRIEEGQPGGTLSSGMDCWLKRVPYPIIDKWYRQNAEGKSYHEDHGEGLDNYHVGASRGCGGIGVWVDDSLYVSKNFTSYKTIAHGPIRTIFELTYAPWATPGVTITEKKRISIDLGSQLSRYEVSLESSAPLPNCTVGITLHDKKGKTHADSVQGWFSYWEPLQDSELGTGVVIDPAFLQTFEDYRTAKKDLSQLYIIGKPVNNAMVYYAGYGWKKAGVFNNDADWNEYLAGFSRRMRSPLVVVVRPSFAATSTNPSQATAGKH